MTVKQIPDYDLDEMIVVTAPGQLRALADPLRGTLLDLLLERAATVTEMALAVDRPKSTVAYHVNLLVDSGLLQVVRTRRVRAIEERYYGRIARTIYIGALNRDEDKQIVSGMNGLAQAAAEAAPASDVEVVSFEDTWESAAQATFGDLGPASVGAPAGDGNGPRRNPRRRRS